MLEISQFKEAGIMGQQLWGLGMWQVPCGAVPYFLYSYAANVDQGTEIPGNWDQTYIQSVSWN